MSAGQFYFVFIFHFKSGSTSFPGFKTLLNVNHYQSFSTFEQHELVKTYQTLFSADENCFPQMKIVSRRRKLFSADENSFSADDMIDIYRRKSTTRFLNLSLVKLLKSWLPDEHQSILAWQFNSESIVLKGRGFWKFEFHLLLKTE